MIRAGRLALPAARLTLAKIGAAGRRRNDIHAKEVQMSHCKPMFAILGALLAGCAEPTAPPVEASPPSAIIIIGGKLIAVLNTNLRYIGNPDISPGAQAHIQLKIFSTEDGGYVINWMGELLQVQCDVFLGGGIYGIQDSEDFPNPETVAAIDLLRGEDRRCSNNLIEGATAVSSELAERLVASPENFLAVFFGDPVGPIAGTLHLAPAAQ
jgi:hypothetical protein